MLLTNNPFSCASSRLPKRCSPPPMRGPFLVAMSSSSSSSSRRRWSDRTAAYLPKSFDSVATRYSVHVPPESRGGRARRHGGDTAHLVRTAPRFASLSLAADVFSSARGRPTRATMAEDGALSHSLSLTHSLSLPLSFPPACARANHEVLPVRDGKPEA